MRPIFADTSYYVALMGPKDQFHESALQWSKRVLGSVVVTEYILVELGGALSRLQDRQLYAGFVDQLLRDRGTVFVPAPQALFRQGLSLFARHADKEWSLVDCISFRRHEAAPTPRGTDDGPPFCSGGLPGPLARG